MNYMFANCTNLLKLDLSYFNSTIATIEGIFENSLKLENIISNDEKICEMKPSGAQCGPN